MYGDGLGFVPDELVDGAEVFVLMQNPWKDEERAGRPAVGKTGDVLNTEFLPRAGLERGIDVCVGNVLKCVWRGTDGTRTSKLPPEAVLKPAMEHCLRTHLQIPASIKLIVAQGALAWRAMNGPGKITDWRGYLAGEDT